MHVCLGKGVGASPVVVCFETKGGGLGGRLIWILGTPSGHKNTVMWFTHEVLSFTVCVYTYRKQD